jgi:hypothetical protein
VGSISGLAVAFALSVKVTEELDSADAVMDAALPVEFAGSLEGFAVGESEMEGD